MRIIERAHWGDTRWNLLLSDARALRAIGVAEVRVDGETIFSDGNIIGEAARKPEDNGPVRVEETPFLRDLHETVRDWGEDDTVDWQEIMQRCENDQNDY